MKLQIYGGAGNMKDPGTQFSKSSRWKKKGEKTLLFLLLANDIFIPRRWRLPGILSAAAKADSFGPPGASSQRLSLFPDLSLTDPSWDGRFLEPVLVLGACRGIKPVNAEVRKGG